MSAPDVWLVILGGMAVTYGSRLSFLILPERIRFPAVFQRGLRLVAPAVLAAVLVPQVLIPSGAASATWNPRVLPAALAGLVGWRTRNAWASIATGMITLWIIQAFLS
ncbi:MAG TPA: AzlD domain-containing protein [Anaerolineales bacterium]|nr:AzlD domain-containing protein [Anaerolineales bacterium]